MFDFKVVKTKFVQKHKKVRCNLYYLWNRM